MQGNMVYLTILLANLLPVFSVTWHYEKGKCKLRSIILYNCSIVCFGTKPWPKARSNWAPVNSKFGKRESMIIPYQGYQQDNPSCSCKENKETLKLRLLPFGQHTSKLHQLARTQLIACHTSVTQQRKVSSAQFLVLCSFGEKVIKLHGIA